MAPATFDREARLALVARAEVARIRAELVENRNALIIAAVEPLTAAMSAFKALHGHDFDHANPRDARKLRPLLNAAGAGHLGWADIEAGRAALAENMAATERVGETMRAVAEAWGGRGGSTVLDWAGCSPEEFEAAVEARLLAEEAVEAELAERLADGRVWRCRDCRAILATEQQSKPANEICSRCSTRARSEDS